jgi:hypothetical protein
MPSGDKREEGTSLVPGEFLLFRLKIVFEGTKEEMRKYRCVEL